MKKSILIAGSILCLFILVSLSYQPIIADTPIETITQVKETKVSVSRVDRFREVYNILVERKSNDDCGCEDTTGWGFPVICSFLVLLLFGIGYYIFVMGYYLLDYSTPIADNLFEMVFNLIMKFNCPLP